MSKIARLLTFFLAITAGAAFAQGTSQPDLDASGRAVLDVVEGRAEMAAISVPYGQALAAAHQQALGAGKRFAPPPSLRFHAIGASGLSVVTVGAPSEDAKRAIAFLRDREARPANVMPAANR
jgi:hypothetical protein